MNESPPAAGNPYANRRHAYYALVILTLVYSFNFIDRQLLAILQESIKADMDLTDAQLGLLTGFAFAVFYVTAGIPIARWADHSNRRNIVALALALWSGMTAISGFVQNYVQLLLARIGVGVGEAGGSPPSHSMISDIFPPERRASALGFYSMGVNIGILFGFLFGGWLNEFFGWRMAFVVVGLPGILLALVVRYTMAEPARGLSENRTVSAQPVGFVNVLRVLWASRAFRHIALAAGLNAFAGYISSNWTASFMIRSHGMSTGELGTWLALIIGVGGAAGVFCGGLLADKLGARDKRWHVWLPCCAGVIAMPFIFAVYLVDEPLVIGSWVIEARYVVLLSMILPAVMSNVYLGNVLALSHGLVGLRMRAMASAILFFIINIIGLGGGPWTAGVVSDWLEAGSALAWFGQIGLGDVPAINAVLTAAQGKESLRYAMLFVVPVAGGWSLLHFFLAARSLREDLRNAPE